MEVLLRHEVLINRIDALVYIYILDAHIILT